MHSQTGYCSNRGCMGAATQTGVQHSLNRVPALHTGCSRCSTLLSKQGAALSNMVSTFRQTGCNMCNTLKQGAAPARCSTHKTGTGSALIEQGDTCTLHELQHAQTGCSRCNCSNWVQHSLNRCNTLHIQGAARCSTLKQGATLSQAWSSTRQTGATCAASPNRVQHS
jgi:hypothetical protein